MNYYFKAFKNYAKFKGRATRKEFWWFILFHCLFLFIFSFIDELFQLYPTIGTAYNEHSMDDGYLASIYSLVTICPSICLQVRRLHDVGKRGYWYLISNIPIVGLYLFYLNLKPSQPIINAYGSPMNNISTIVCNEDRQVDKSNKIRFCRKCGYKLVTGSDFCSQCGTRVLTIEEKDLNIFNTQNFTVITYDTSTGKIRTEMRKVDVKKFPPEKLSDNNTYYAVETMKEGKKVRVYCTKTKWQSQIDNQYIV